MKTSKNGRKMVFTQMKIKEFINYIITHENINSILDTCAMQSEKGFIFERLFDIVIKFGFCDIFNNKYYHHLIGNVNNARLKILNDINTYLDEYVISGNSNGCSDITLKNKNDSTYIFITSKYPKSHEDITKQKSINYYDIQNIIALTTKYTHIYKEYKIYLVVNNKTLVLNKVKHTNESSKYITEYITENNILDLHDLNKYFQLFKQDIIKNKIEDWTEIYLLNKEHLTLRFHQELITQKTCNLIKQGHKSFLWGCKCRSGKTYMIGGIICKQLNIKHKLNILIITPAPSETLSQFTIDLFYKFRDFNKFKIHNINSSNYIDTLQIDTNNIFIVSKQLIQKYVENETIMEIKNLNLDIIAFDENHFGGTTFIAKNILDSYCSSNTVKIYLTATYNKPLHEWNISQECQMYWDIEDEQICKSIVKDENNITKLDQRHGRNYITETVRYFLKNGYSIDEIFRSYEKMPDLYLITTMFDTQRYDIIKQKIMGSCYGFSFDVLFSLNSNYDFTYSQYIQVILRYITGSQREIDYKNGDKSIFSRIKCIQSRTPFIQIWFLPPNNISIISQKLKLLMLSDNILKNYNILCINRKDGQLVKNVKDEILKQETIARSSGKDGLILLAGNMLNLGITLDSCDIVILLNNTMSSDKIMQQMYRCMTEGENKKMGFVVDLNISRVVYTCVSYTLHNNNINIDDKIRYIIENHLIHIDVDYLIHKKINYDDIIKKILDIWKSNPVNSFRTILKNLDNDYITFDNPTQQILNSVFSDSMKDKTYELITQFNTESQNIPSGRIKNIDVHNSDDTENNNDDVHNTIKISFTKDVLPYIIPLTCILTIREKNNDFINMLNAIKQNNELLEIFDEQCLIWWNNKNLIQIISTIVNNYFTKSSNTYNITIQFKLSLQSLIDRPKELLELINDCLKPKNIEKKKYGEVFTPVDFINNCMLKDIEDYWHNKYNENIWTNDKLTWYDPATGMGNYPIAIYFKLFDGLKNKIKNIDKRKKHIIEHQLFMGELNKKNCFIIRQIFNIDGKYKLNLHDGNSLDIDIKHVFNVDKFDVTIGNPPYNEELTRVGAKPLYNKFIEFYIDKCNILSFITPSRWFAGGKGLDKFRHMMINRHDILFIKHFDNASDIFDNLINIEGGVSYFLIDSEYNGPCNYNGTEIELNKFDVIVDSKYYGIINKLSKKDKITKYYKSQDYYKIQTNDTRLIDELKENYIKCYVSQQKGLIKYIDRNEIKKQIDNYKIITARANGKCGCFGNTFIGQPNEIHSKSYISFNVNSEIEAQSLLSYLKCKLPNFMLSLRKISQDISESTCKWIPLVPLDREWTNEKIYKYFKLTNDEIKLIEDTHIIGYKY